MSIVKKFVQCCLPLNNEEPAHNIQKTFGMNSHLWQNKRCHYKHLHVITDMSQYKTLNWGEGSKVPCILPAFVNPPSHLLFIIWTTPTGSPLLMIGIHKMLWVVYPVCLSISLKYNNDYLHFGAWNDEIIILMLQIKWQQNHSSL